MGNWSEKAIAFLKNSVGYIMATLFTAAYIGLSILTIDRTGRSIGEIIGTGFVYYIYQIALTSLLRPQGLTNGKNDENYKATATLHSDKVEEVSEDMHLLPVWCEKKNQENYRDQRKKILASEALKYSDYFEDDGTVKRAYEIDSSKMSLRWKNRFIRREEKKRYRAYRQAVRLKLTELDATSLTSGDKSKVDKYALPESEKEFLGRKFFKDVIVKALPAILFGLYGVKEVADLNRAAFAWTVFQAVTGFASAVAEMIFSKHYIVNDVRTGMVKKIGWLDDFLGDLKSNPQKYNVNASADIAPQTQKKEHCNEQNDECNEKTAVS